LQPVTPKSGHQWLRPTAGWATENPDLDQGANLGSNAKKYLENNL
jgi:hypothetical protein